MCAPASMIVTRTRVYWLPYCDSHEEIIKAKKLKDGMNPDFVRIEITPICSDYKQPIDKWIYKTDQDYIPDWYLKEEAEIACRKELSKWYAKHIITEGIHEFDADKYSNFSLIVLGGEVTINNQSGGDCRAYDTATLNASNQSGGDCRAYDTATLNASNQSGGDCRAYDTATKNIIES